MEIVFFITRKTDVTGRSFQDGLFWSAMILEGIVARISSLSASEKRGFRRLNLTITFSLQ